MIGELNQGDVIKIPGIKYPIIVVSKNSFNVEGEIIGCPFIEGDEKLTLYVPLIINEKKGFACCDVLKTFDLKTRGYKRIYRLPMLDTMSVADAIQSIFDYIYP